MATKGWVGKIAHVDLTTKEVKVFESDSYVEWLGGHGLASALFWDFCEDKTAKPFDPANLIVIATNPLSGTLVPTAASRVEITGIGSFADHEWYTRSSMGGRIAGGMKRAGFDAFMVTGISEEPVWINVIDGEIKFEDASKWWGSEQDSWEIQKDIMGQLTNGAGEGEWYTVPGSKKKTMLRPAVMCIPPICERLGRVGGIVHDANHIAAQSGFGAVWGSKKLKALSFTGTQTFEVADPTELLALRREVYLKRDYKIDRPDEVPYDPFVQYHQYNIPGQGNVMECLDYLPHRPEACEGCPTACRSIFPDSKGNESYCIIMAWGRGGEDSAETGRKNADILNRHGVNGWEVATPAYVYSLYKRGLVGPGKEIDSLDLDFSKVGTHEFSARLLDMMIKREGLGNELADGLARAAHAWGTWDEDSTTGELCHPQWGYGEHYSPQVETDWSFGSIFGERDINEHSFNHMVYWMPMATIKLLGIPPMLTAEDLVNMISRTANGLDPRCWDYSEENCFSEYRRECIYYYRHWTRVWEQSLTFCDWSWGGMRLNFNDPYKDYFIDLDDYGCKFYTAVTGLPLAKTQAYEIGRRIWNLDKSIWTMQGRHRDDEVFANYVYERPNPEDGLYPMCLDGEWVYGSGKGRVLDRDKFEEFKGSYYKREGWDPKTGWPTRATLEGLNLSHVADALEKIGKLGSDHGKPQPEKAAWQLA
jgi:aldehyde:ferredoxin oxidoreductase